MNPEQVNPLPRPVFWAGLLAVCGVMLAIAARFALEQGVAWPCVFLNVTGLPCFFCGGTRALAALSQFDWLTALRLNPLVLMGGLVLLGAPFWWGRFQRMPRAGWVAGAVLLMLNWVYLCFQLPR